MKLSNLAPARWRYPLSELKRAVFGYKTYAQFGEDQVLAELFKDTSHGVYVDVGAHHPTRYSNTFLLYKKGWHGVNIDPNPRAIELFKKARPRDTNLACGVGNAGTLTYYRFSDPAVNTFVAQEAGKWKQKKFLAFLGTTQVEVKPLAALVQGPIDLLTIDAEGMDLEVLQSWGWHDYPRIVVVEGERAGEFLIQKGYTLRAHLGPSRIFSR